MNIGPLFVAHARAPELIQSNEGSFHYPAPSLLQSCHAQLPAANQSAHSAPASPARRNGSVARRRYLVSHATAAGRSCQNRSRVAVAASPGEFHCGRRTESQTNRIPDEQNPRRTESRLDKHGPASGVCHPEPTREGGQQRLNQIPQGFWKQRAAHSLSILAIG